MLNPRQRSRLAGMAQTRRGLVRLGRDGAGEAFVARLAVLLADHELVKLRFVGREADKESIARNLAARTDSEIVRLTGNTAVFWKVNPDPGKRKVEID